jgi:hypothetical protein
MKAANERKLFGILNIFDLVILLLVAGVSVYAVLYLATGGFRRGENVYVYYTVQFEGLTEDHTLLLNIGDEVKDSIRGFTLGTIVDIDVRESMVWLYNEIEGEWFQYYPPGDYVIHMTIKAKGHETDIDIVANTVPVRLGHQMYAQGKGWVLTGYIVAVRTEPIGGGA